MKIITSLINRTLKIAATMFGKATVIRILTYIGARRRPIDTIVAQRVHGLLPPEESDVKDPHALLLQLTTKAIKKSS